MTVYLDKIRKCWRYDFQFQGKRYSKDCIDPATGALPSCRRDAVEIEARIRSALKNGCNTQPMQPGDITVAQALAAYATQVKDMASWGNQRVYVRELLDFFGAETPIAELSETRVWDYVAWSRRQKLRVWIGGRLRPGGKLPTGKREADYWHQLKRTRSDSTINRYLNALRKALSIMARQRHPQTGLPMLAVPPKVPKLKEPDALPRPIGLDNLADILVRAPAHVADAVQLCVLMGFRLREVLGLTIKHVDLDNRGVWLQGGETKANRAEFIPANNAAMNILRRLVNQAKKRKIDHLIAYRHGKEGIWKPIKSLRRAWRSTLKACGLEGQHRFHNTKATFVTAVAMNASASVAQQLARHKDFETTRRYIRVADAIARQAVESINYTVKAENAGESPTYESHTNLNMLPGVLSNPLNNLVGMAGFEPTTPSPPD